MNIVDANGVQYIFAKNLNLKNDYYLAPDVEEELELAQMKLGKRLPARIFGLARTDEFDEAIYLSYYRDILNKYGGRSFFNMTGFGDVSILAVLLMLTEKFSKREQQSLLLDFERLFVYTDDKRLIKKIKKELVGKNVEVKPSFKIL